MEKLRVALVGAGGRGTAHANAIATAPNIEFAAICDLDEAVGRAAAEKFNTEYISSTKELYQRDDIRAVGICVQTPAHYKLAMEAISAGRHVITEKPMAATIAEAKEMRDTAEEANIRAALSYQLRLGPLYAKMRDICDQIDPIQIYFARQRSMLVEKYLSPAPFDGIMDFISHDIDMVPYLAQRTPTTVYASLRRNTWATADAIEVVNVQIEFGEGDDKIVGCLSSSMGGGGFPQRLDVIGKHGFAATEGTVQIVMTSQDNPPGPTDKRDMWTLQLDAQARDFTADLYAHWAACVMDPSMDIAPAATYQDGYNALLITLAIVESGQSGEKINLADFAASLA